MNYLDYFFDNGAMPRATTRPVKTRLCSQNIFHLTTVVSKLNDTSQNPSKFYVVTLLVVKCLVQSYRLVKISSFSIPNFYVYVIK